MEIAVLLFLSSGFCSACCFPLPLPSTLLHSFSGLNFKGRKEVVDHWEMEVSKSTGFLILVGVLMALMTSSQAYTFYAGGKDGWVVSPSDSYGHWAERNRFQVNDTIVFRYSEGENSVLVVNKEDFDACNVSNPIQKLEGGDSKFEFDRSGPFFFISGVLGNCQKGQKLVVVVLSVRHKKPSPPSSPPSLPTSSPTPQSPSSSPVLAPSASLTHVPSPSATSPSPAPVSPVHVPAPAPSRPVSGPSPVPSPSFTKTPPSAPPAQPPSPQSPAAPVRSGPGEPSLAPAPEQEKSASSTMSPSGIAIVMVAVVLAAFAN